MAIHLIPEVPYTRVSRWPDPSCAELCGCHVDAVDKREVSECSLSTYTKEKKKDKENLRVINLCPSQPTGYTMDYSRTGAACVAAPARV